MSFDDWQKYGAMAVVPIAYVGAIWAILTAQLPAFNLTLAQSIDYALRFFIGTILTFGMAWGYLYVKACNHIKICERNHPPKKRA